MDCQDIERLAELSLDGEIDARDRAELESHLAQCPSCNGSVGSRKWYMAQVRAKLQVSSDDMPIPPHLRSKIATTIQHEHKTSGGIRWQRAIPISIAAAGILVLAWSRSGEATLDPEEPVARHTKNLPPEVRARGSEREVHRFFERNLEYPVAVPRPAKTQSSVRLVGARLSNIHDRDAAYMMYDQRGARISLFAYPSPKRTQKPVGFKEHVVHGHPLLVGQHRGYNVVTWSQGPMTYSLVSDVDSAQLIELAVSTAR